MRLNLLQNKWNFSQSIQSDSSIRPFEETRIFSRSLLKNKSSKALILVRLGTVHDNIKIWIFRCYHFSRFGKLGENKFRDVLFGIVGGY